MILLFNIYLIAVLFTFFILVYDDIRYKDLGILKSLSAIILSMAWPFILSLLILCELEEWYNKKVK